MRGLREGMKIFQGKGWLFGGQFQCACLYWQSISTRKVW
ncbi:hypothetical protein ADIMK_0046 [Marinobacterium lacunae]|uniref:Uncharacterized protein n=1 Tax=Marinobacterium lacunae TaxID=1232683 RepID=A0A081G4M9_9GAMM|nr:hypothetical protein ADIMK_0046 [Marinobacterium lacunae]